MRPTVPARTNRGFTLLEVMISLAILAISLVAISGLNGGAIAMESYARRATEATLLLRGKMNDVEEQLQKDGFSDFDDEKHGTFDDDGARGFAWRAEILKPDVQLDASQLLNLLGAGGGGASSSAGTSNGGSMLTQGLTAAGAAIGTTPNQGGPTATSAIAGGPMGGLLQTQATGFLETLKKSVRELRVTVSVSASQEIVILPESVGKTEQPQTQSQAQQPPGVPIAPAAPTVGRTAP